MRRLLSVDPMTATRTYVDYDENEDALRIIEEVDVDRLLELNRAMFNEAPSNWGDGASVARMPMVLREKLKREGIIRADGDTTLWKRWLNDPDNRGWRIRPGRI